MKKYAVIGNPVSHSLSPVIHQKFAGQFDIDLAYSKIHAEPADFGQQVSAFKAAGGCGLNVTLPFKKEAFAISDQLSKPALLAESVNTLSFRNNTVAGDNTDGTGLVKDLQVHHIGLHGKRILILGAGGAVSGVIGPLLDQQPELIVIANRTVQKALDLQARFCKFGQVTGCGLNQTLQIKFDLVINGTAASLAGSVPQIDPKVLDSVELAYDMMYAARPTAFIRWVRRHADVRTADGLGMLVAQAAASFYIWHGKTPDTGAVVTQLRNLLNTNAPRQ